MRLFVLKTTILVCFLCLSAAALRAQHKPGDKAPSGSVAVLVKVDNETLKRMGPDSVRKLLHRDLGSRYRGASKNGKQHLVVRSADQPDAGRVYASVNRLLPFAHIEYLNAQQYSDAYVKFALE